MRGTMRFLKITSLVLSLILLAFLSLSLAQSGAPASQPQTAHVSFTEVKHINGLKSQADLAKELIRLHRQAMGATFTFTSDQDFKDATQTIVEADQGGMALPDPDYYIKDDPKSVELRKQYLDHVQKMF